MVFDCPWGCAELSSAERGVSGGPFHENAWECPRFSEKFLEAVQAITQKPGKGNP